MPSTSQRWSSKTALHGFEFEPRLSPAALAQATALVKSSEGGTEPTLLVSVGAHADSETTAMQGARTNMEEQYYHFQLSL